MLPIAMLSGHHRYILIAYNRQKLLLLCTVASAIAAVLLGFALVPLYRGQGAAWALAMIAIFLNFALVYYCVRRFVVEVPVVRQLAAPLLTLAVSAVAYTALVQWNSWLALICGSAVYAAGLLWFSGRQLASVVRTIATSRRGYDARQMNSTETQPRTIWSSRSSRGFC